MAPILVSKSTCVQVPPEFLSKMVTGKIIGYTYNRVHIELFCYKILQCSPGEHEPCENLILVVNIFFNISLLY